MRVYLCVNRAVGLGLLKSSPKTEQKHAVYTQKQTAIKEFQKSITTGYLRKSIQATTNKKFPIMVFLLDIPYKYLTYISGDMLDPYTTEYESKMDTKYSYDLKRFNIEELLSVESWHFHINKTKLKYKRTLSLH